MLIQKNINARYRVKGIVQGVGFRPFVYRLAKAHNLVGWVLNDSLGVLIEVRGRENSLQLFKAALRVESPKLALITEICEEQASTTDHTEFMIVASNSQGDTTTIVPPDTDVCGDCLTELYDPQDRRYKYPFINCTNCGPRYSLIKKMPYDRRQTSMSSFPMCARCLAEYEDVEDRRYHAQPNACVECGPEVWICDKHGEICRHSNPINTAIQKLIDGRILAVKSLGGFHLVADATNEQAVKTLRQRKKRDSKPFALMVKSSREVAHYAHMSIAEQREMNKPEKPIVLLKKKKGSPIAQNVAPNNPDLGIMLPSAPLHHLLLDDPRLKSLIMTSANLSGEPIVYKNDEALESLKEICDYFVLHNRDIVTQVDDSLLRITETRCGKNIRTLLRRSRGYAPFPVRVETKLRPLAALGAELKTTVALSKNSDVFLSQHIGDLKNNQSFERHKQTTTRLAELLDIEIEGYAVDLHPQFRSSVRVVEQDKLPVTKVQHHHAHMASCLAEHGITDENVIGVIFDGTGYGTDGTIWGGEFLLGGYSEFSRVGFLRPFQLLGGDKAVKEPIRTAMSILADTFGSSAADLAVPSLNALSAQRRLVYAKMAIQKINTVPTSSMGRLFDGVSALIGLCPIIEYEAQAAIELEGLLQRDLTLAASYRYELVKSKDCLQVDYRPMIEDIVSEISQGKADIPLISRRFHSTLVQVIAEVCRHIRKKMGANTVALSGGVFMNEYLLANAYTVLKEDCFDVLVHDQTPANDGGLALGQLMVANAQYKTHQPSNDA